MEKFRSPKAIWIENKPQDYRACTDKSFISNFRPNLYVEIPTIARRCDQGGRMGGNAQVR